MKDNKWVMQYNEVYDLGQKRIVPMVNIVISDEIKSFIESYADVEHDEMGIKTYVVNKLRFKIAPHLES